MAFTVRLTGPDGEIEIADYGVLRELFDDLESEAGKRGWSGCEHEWETVPDWYGDPNVINGAADCSYLRCRKCGEEAPLGSAECAAPLAEEDW